MKTKLFALVFVLVLIVCAFASCGGHTHDYESVVTPPDCATGTDGFTTFTCECGDTYTGDEVTAAHTWSPIETKEANCQEGGYTLEMCVGCETTRKVDETAKDATKHIYSGEWTSDATKHWKEATCGCAGVPNVEEAEHTPGDDGKCTVCGAGVCAHPNKQVLAYSAPTCVDDGVELFNCADCGLRNKQVVVPALGHDYDDGEVIEPDCDDIGYTLYTCQRETCTEDTEGHVKQTDTVPPLGHDFDADGVCTECAVEATVKVTYVYLDAEGVEVTNYNPAYFIAKGTVNLEAASRPNTEEYKYRFVGWFLDEACTAENKVDYFDTNVPGEYTLYGKWNEESTSNHQHTYEDEWDFDERDHWKNSTCEHRDKVEGLGAHTWDSDRYCTVCGRRDPEWEQTYTITWDTTNLIMQLNEDSNNTELPASSKRYLAGATGDNKTVDTLVRNRNNNAYAKTGVTVTYAYLDDGIGYGWGANIDHIFQEVGGSAPDKPDIYVNFVYDMLAASLKGCFMNLYTTQRGENLFQFADRAFKDTGTGYMVDYMKSMTLSNSQMYLLSSDYFIDMVRAFFVVPVNLTKLGSVNVDEGSLADGYQPTMADKFNSDRDGDEDFDIEDFYKLVWQHEWNYDTLGDFAGAVYAQGEAMANPDPMGTLNDELGFAIATSSGLSSSGMLYTTTVEIIHREWSDEDDNFTFYYPTTNADLLTFCNNIKALFTENKGIIAIDDDAGQTYGTDALRAIRARFSEGHILFGGVICLGSLEYDEYREMSNGFGIVPVPLYRTGDENGRADEYQTQIHNLGRVGAISRTTTKFTQCSAFLDYQSTHSTDILNDYYGNELSYAIAGGSQSNVEMLQFIRRNVRSSFDKAFEDAIGIHFSNNGGVDVGGDKDLSSLDQKWHNLIKNAGYKLGADQMKPLYDTLVVVKARNLETLKNSYKSLPQ